MSTIILTKQIEDSKANLLQTYGLAEMADKNRISTDSSLQSKYGILGVSRQFIAANAKQSYLTSDHRLNNRAYKFIEGTIRKLFPQVRVNPTIAPPEALADLFGGTVSAGASYSTAYIGRHNQEKQAREWAKGNVFQIAAGDKFYSADTRDIAEFIELKVLTDKGNMNARYAPLFASLIEPDVTATVLSDMPKMTIDRRLQAFSRIFYELYNVNH